MLHSLPEAHHQIQLNLYPTPKFILKFIRSVSPASVSGLLMQYLVTPLPALSAANRLLKEESKQGIQYQKPTN